MNQKIAKMIAEYQEDKDFYGRIKDVDINKIEEELGLKIPEQYRDFILEIAFVGLTLRELRASLVLQCYKRQKNTMNMV